jgi:enterochelin esterase family protein
MSSPNGGTGPVIPQYNLNTDAIAKDLPELDESINGKLRLLYVSCGLDDGLVTSNMEFEDWLGTRGVHFTHDEVPGYAHVWSFWRRSLVEVAPMLFH